MDDYPNMPVVALDQIARLQEENARLKAALEPIREVWEEMKRYATRYDMPYNSMESAIERCMEILEKEEADV